MSTIPSRSASLSRGSKHPTWPVRSIDEVKQIFKGMNEDPQMRPQAQQICFFNPTQFVANRIQPPREHLDPGPPLGRGQMTAFGPGAQPLLVTYATNAPEVVGTLLQLDKPAMTV